MHRHPLFHCFLISLHIVGVARISGTEMAYLCFQLARSEVDIWLQTLMTEAEALNLVEEYYHLPILASQRIDTRGLLWLQNTLMTCIVSQLVPTGIAAGLIVVTRRNWLWSPAENLAVKSNNLSLSWIGEALICYSYSGNSKQDSLRKPWSSLTLKKMQESFLVSGSVSEIRLSVKLRTCNKQATLKNQEFTLPMYTSSALLAQPDNSLPFQIQRKARIWSEPDNEWDIKAQERFVCLNNNKGAQSCCTPHCVFDQLRQCLELQADVSYGTIIVGWCKFVPLWLSVSRDLVPKYSDFTTCWQAAWLARETRLTTIAV